MDQQQHQYHRHQSRSGLRGAPGFVASPKRGVDLGNVSLDTEPDSIDTRRWTVPRFKQVPPSKLNLQAIAVAKPASAPPNSPAPAPVRSSNPLTLLVVPPSETFGQASSAIGGGEAAFARSGLNRAVPGSPHHRRASQRGAAETTAGPLRLVVFKLPSTGSTFFTELLQSVPHTHVAKELLTAMDANKGTAELTRAMGHALTTPMRGHNQGVDHSAGAKSPLSIIGFTVCPAVLPFADFSAAVKPFGDRARIVALVRSNTVKHGIGIWRAAALRAKCHTNNVRSHEELSGKCLLPSRTSIPLADFQKNLRVAALHTLLMLGAAYSTGLDVYEVTYEDLQEDPTATIVGLYRDSFNIDLLSSGGFTLGSGGVGSTKKFTGDDLRTLLTNFDEIEAYLDKHVPCYAPMLRSSTSESFPHCAPPFESVHVHHVAATKNRAPHR